MNPENKKTGLLFPGQGSQFVGMGEELHAEFEVARKVYKRASEALGVDIAALCFSSEKEKLMRTDICQPAILTASIAALRVFQEAVGAGLHAAAGAGLSLGEYSALVAAGSVGLEQAVELTAARGRFMQHACEINPGTMYSVIGLESNVVEDICRALREEGALVWPANYNSPGQLVISGEPAATAEAAKMCEEKGARRSIKLNVAGAFHTPLMAPAAEIFEEKLADVDFKSCRFPVLSNVSARPHGNPGEIRGMLSRQVTEPVKWSQSVQWFVEMGVTDFYEIGPGKVLSGLMRRIDRSLSCVPVMSPADIKKIAVQAPK